MLKSLRCDPTRLESFLRAELENRVGLAPGWERSDPKTEPSSRSWAARAGKTTSLAKLAVSHTRVANARPQDCYPSIRRRSRAPAASIRGSTFGIAFQEVPAPYLLPGLIAICGKRKRFLSIRRIYGVDGNAAENARGLCGLPQPGHAPGGAGIYEALDLRLCIQRYARFRPPSCW